jgi:hypothetical protein
MTKIVSLLEQNIIEQGNRAKEEKHFSDRVDEFSLTTITQKESKPRDHQQI